MAEQGVTQVLHVLDQVLARLEPVPIDKESVDKWLSRLQASQPALAAAEFPVTEAALFLGEIIRQQMGNKLARDVAVQLIHYYLSTEDAGALWQECSIAATLGEAWVHLACQAALARTADAVAQQVSLADWHHRECPVCGTLPAFASLEGEGGQRSLVCGSCLTRWRYKRIGCAFCGEDQPDRLKVLTTEEFPGWSAAVCLTCHGYIKTADLRQMATRPRWQQAALTTLPLDYAVVRWLEIFRLQQAT